MMGRLQGVASAMAYLTLSFVALLFDQSNVDDESTAQVNILLP